MFGNKSNTRSLPMPFKRTSAQNSPLIERALDDKMSFEQSTTSVITLTDANINKMASPAIPEHTSTPISSGSVDVVDAGKTGKSKGHRRTRSLERGINMSTKTFDNSGITIPKRMCSVLNYLLTDINSIAIIFVLY